MTKRPDIDIIGSSVPFSGSTAGPGSKFRGRYTLYNRPTNSAFTTNFVVTYYYCTSTTVASCTTNLGSQTITQNFNSGQAYTYTSMELTLPANAINGTRYIRALADRTNAVIEGNENNNDDFDPISVTGARPDLLITASTVPASGSTAGHNSAFTARYTIRNNTAQGFTTNFVVQFFSCLTAATTSCTPIGTQAVSDNFNGFQSRTYTSPTLRLPNTVVYGTRYIRTLGRFDKHHRRDQRKQQQRLRPDLCFNST